ncbi:MAG: hypothetical protein GY854_18115 [Deltaproteobacteria bacterium]|nr:hypothetical protein [Deltaproteobacteria bacterium]
MAFRNTYSIIRAHEFGALFFLLLLFVSFPAETKPQAPVVAVIEFVPGAGVYSSDAHRLTRKTRSIVAREAKSCRVIGSRKMRKLNRRHRSAISACTTDCAAEHGRIIGADYVIIGNIEETDSGIEATLELYSVETGSLVSSKKRERPNMDELQNAIVAAVPELVTPLTNIVLQATDDEGPTKGPAENPEAVVSAPASHEDPLAENNNSEELWPEAREKPPLLEDEMAELIGLGIGINGGYSFLFARGADMDKALTPLYHLGLELNYQLFPLFQIALVGDFEHMRGNAFKSEEYVHGVGDVVPYTTLYSSLDMYWMLGIRPTFRLDIHIKFFELMLGVGGGAQYTSTSGRWMRTATAMVDDNDPEATEQKQIEVTQTAYYKFKHSNWGLYLVFECAAVFRFLEQRLGVGLLALYTLPFIGMNGTKPEVEVIGDTGHMPGSEHAIFWSYPDDFRNTYVRHLNAISLLTIGLTVDVKF